MYNFEDREVTNPMTYTMVTNADGTVTLTPAPGTVSAEGTPINKKTMEDLQKDIYNTLYPVGHVMIKADASDYSTWLDFTWERIAQGDALVGFKANDAQYGQIGVEFGQDSVTATYNGSSGATTLTIEQIPSHNHGVNDSGHTHSFSGSSSVTDIYPSGMTSVNTDFGNSKANVYSSNTSTDRAVSISGTTGSTKTGISTQNAGEGKSHTHTIDHSHAISVVQKSYPVAVWKRIT